MTDLVRKLSEVMERLRLAEAEIERLTSRVREAEVLSALMEAVLDWGLEGDDPGAVDPAQGRSCPWTSWPK